MRVSISSLDPKFPAALRYPGGPTDLEAIGEDAETLDRLVAPIAIVGTRRPSPEAWQYTHWLAGCLARSGATIVSGGAYGIDTAAHEGALAAGGRTIAFLPTSVDAFSPAGNSALFKRIAQRGALVGFRKKGDEPRFHERNAAMAAIVEHVIMVSAPLKSGARNTADEARRRGRVLWVVPGAPWDATMAGNAIELTLGAHPLISPQSILRQLGLRQHNVGSHKDVAWKTKWTSSPRDPNPAPPPRTATVVTDPSPPASPLPPGLFSIRAGRPLEDRLTMETILPAPEERRLLEALSNGPGTVDDLVLRTALPVAPVRALLLTWTVEGVVREGPVGLFRLLNR